MAMVQGGFRDGIANRQFEGKRHEANSLSRSF